MEAGRFLHGIIRSGAGEAYAQKRESFDALLRDTGTDLGRFTERTFGDRTFSGTDIPKATLILELLHDRLSPRSWRFIRDRLRLQPYLTDRRHTEEYAFDIALGWLEEEFLVEALRKSLPRSTSIERVGVDRFREYVDLNIRATADLELGSAHRRIRVDLFVDHTGSWRRNSGMDLKQGKLLHFRNGTLDCVLGLDLNAGRFHLVGPRRAAGIPLVENAAMGGTKTARVSLGRALNVEAAAARLAAMLGQARVRERRVRHVDA